MLSAKEMFDLTKGRSQKAKEEKFDFVQQQLSLASEKEQFQASFSFIQLKPFAGAIIEKLTELGYTVEQPAGSVKIIVSWDLTPKTAKKAVAKPAQETVDNSKSSNEDYYDDDEDYPDYEDDHGDL